ncbi:MAG: heparinase II/III domain-containing protein, partial [Streptosporangiaceae bacterium]
HARFLRLHLESDVGGNHLIKDLKALIGLGVFLGDDPLLRRALRLLIGQLSIQVLPDGGHFERAPAYHCQVLADLIDVAALLTAAGLAPAPTLTMAIARMRRWLGAVLAPDGTVPLLNDGFPVPGALVAALRAQPPPSLPLLRLAESGLVRAAAGDWHLLADVGAPCPDELPAHAHADTLGCVLYVGGAPVLVDTGTSTYEAGPDRCRERSTAAHNTAEIDGRDSTEVWGAFRAGRRARVRAVSARATGARVTVAAAHDGYRHLAGRPCHRRRWTLTAAGLEVDDRITGEGRHEVAVRWHLTPATDVSLIDGGALVSTSAGKFAVTVAGTTPVKMEIESAPIAFGFLRAAAAPVLTCRSHADLPLRLTTSWQRAG